MSETLYLNGEWLAPNEAKVSVFDRGFLFADGIYEVVSVYQGQLFLLDRHLARLQRSLAALQIANKSDQEWQALFQDVVRRNQIENGLVYLQVTRGADEKRAHLPTKTLTPTVLITVTALDLPTGVPNPVRVCAMEDIRWQRCDIKSISLLGNIMLKQQATALGCLEPLLHRDGRVTEGASCNYFMVKDKVLYTPPKDHLILPGISRDWVVELARKQSIEVREEAFSLTDVYQADELFLTSSSREVQAVGWVGEHAIQDAQVGPMTLQLLELFRATVPAHAAQDASLAS